MMACDPTRLMIPGLVLCILAAAYVWRTDQAEGVCIDRDMPATERVFGSCIAAQSKHNVHAASDCRREAERLACKSWSRP